MAHLGYILTKQGSKTFDGQSRKAGHAKGSTILYAVRSSIYTPVDLDHAAITSKRAHRPLQVEIAVDSSSYQYHNAVIDKDKDGTKKLDVEIGLFRTNQAEIGMWGAGENSPYFKINLADAFVLGVELVMQSRDVELKTDRMVVKFAYRQIEWVFMNGNKSTNDAWNA